MKKSAVIVIFLYLILYIIPLGKRPISMRDESRYGEIPREMCASGDWIVPRLNGIRYFEKPVLGYWLNAASIKIFGENTFAIRFPSALSVGLSALAIFFIVRKFANGYSVGIFSAAAFLICPGVFGIGVFSVLDSMFAMFVTLSLVSFFFAYKENKLKRKNVFLVLSGVFCGLAFLIKGFLAFALPAIVIVPFMIWDGRWKELFKFAWLPIVAAILISLPWCIMIHLREPDFWHYFFWIEHIQRFFSAADRAQHAEPFWFFVPILIGFVLPWIIPVPAVLSGLRKVDKKNSLIRFAICWFLLIFLFFSASRGKLGTYILPCLPPLMIIAAIGLYRYFEDKKTKTFSICALISALLAGILAGVLAVSQTSRVFNFRFYNETENWKWISACTGLLIWGIFSLLAAKSKDWQKKLALYCIAPVLFMFSLHFIVPEQGEEGCARENFFLRYLPKINTNTLIVSDSYLIRPVCWYYKRSDVYLLGSSGELTYGLNYPDSKHRLLTLDQFKKLIKDTNRKKRVILIIEAERFIMYDSQLPEPIFKDIDTGITFVEF